MTSNRGRKYQRDRLSQAETLRWPTDAIPGRTREEMAAADAAEFTTLGHEAMRVQLALERDLSAKRRPK